MELLPEDQLTFNKMADTIRESFELCGFVPLDTPVIEKAEILMAKGGQETEKQTYNFKKGDTEMALRFDLTVPFARYVSQNLNQLNFPFKRYQIGKVFRGERPQKGRFREFYQCDIDIIDKDSLSPIYDAEILLVTCETFNRLNIGGYMVKVNNRKLLTGFINSLGLQDKAKEILREIDKKDKTGEDSVAKELQKLGCSAQQTEEIISFINIGGDKKEIIKKLEALKISEETFKIGLAEITEFEKNATLMNVSEQNWKIDLSVARGLDYYTGTVYETVLIDYPELGSVCGGGRYENLCEYFSEQKLPGVGVSIGLTRLFNYLKEKNVTKSSCPSNTEVLVMPLGDYLDVSYALVSELIKNNISAGVLNYGDGLKKKMSIASKLGAKYAVIIGEDEIKNNIITIKNMETGKQEQVYFEKVVDFIASGN